MINKKIALITGCTKGLGEALLIKLVEQNWKVIGCGRTESKINKLAETYKNKTYLRSLDVSNKDHLNKFLMKSINTIGIPNLVINNAGIINKNAKFWELELNEINNVLDINIKATAQIIHFLIPQMIKNNGGVIINLSSGWGRSTSPEVAPYCCSKWAIEGLSKAIAQELPNQMACVPLNPGVINTEMLQSCFGESAAAYHDATKWSEIALPLILNILKDPNKYNGQSLSI